MDTLKHLKNRIGVKASYIPNLMMDPLASPHFMTEQSFPKEEEMKMPITSSKSKPDSIVPLKEEDDFFSSYGSSSDFSSYASSDFDSTDASGSDSERRERKEKRKKKKKKKNKSGNRKERKGRRRSSEESRKRSSSNTGKSKTNSNQGGFATGKFGTTDMTALSSDNHSSTSLSDFQFSNGSDDLTFSNMRHDAHQPSGHFMPQFEVRKPEELDPRQDFGGEGGIRGLNRQLDECSHDGSEMSDITFGTFHEQVHGLFNNPEFVASFGQKPPLNSAAAAKPVDQTHALFNNDEFVASFEQKSPPAAAAAAAAQLPPPSKQVSAPKSDEESRGMFDNPEFVASLDRKPPPKPAVGAKAPPAGRKTSPRGGLGIRPGSKRASRSRGFNNPFMEKAAILEEYDYDQPEDEFDDEFEDDFDQHEEEKEEEVEPPPAAATSMMPARGASKIKHVDKWDMLSEEFEEAAFGQAVGGLRPTRTPSLQPNNQSRQTAARSQPRRMSAPTGSDLQGFKSGASGAGDANHDLLVMYLKSMGTDAETAETLAETFNKERDAGTSGDHSMMNGMSAEPQFGSATTACIPGNEHPSDDPIAKKMRMLSAPPVQAGNGRRRVSYSRSETPGAVVMESRAFGAPRRPPTTMGPPETAAEKPAAKDFCEAPVAVEAELVEAKALSIDLESGDGTDLEIVYAESSPLSFKTLFRERRFRRVFLLILVVFIAVIVISLSVTLTKTPATSVVETWAPSTAPSSQPTRIDDDFASAAAQVSGWEALLTPGTPQREAIAWLSTHDQSNMETTDVRFLQRYALLVLFFATGGEAWLKKEDWADPTLNECEWSSAETSIVCQLDPSKRQIVTGIDLSRNGLVGKLPPEVGLLSQLTSLIMSKNSLTGAVPTEMLSLERLKILELNTNQFTGTIATEIGRAADLSHLDLSSNQLTGSLPVEFYELGNLFWLDLSSNQITGELIRDIGKLKRLSSINVRHNLISGTIPRSFDEVPKLDFILMDDNLLTGGLPEWSGALVTRQELSISHNMLVGTIPGADSLGAIGADLLSSIRLQLVDMAYNSFDGTVPPLVSFVQSLRYFDFSGNDFNGTFPNGPGMWPGLEHIGGRENRFSGPYPAVFQPGMKYIDFSDNLHDGTVPSELASLPELEYVDLSHNNLRSTIPEGIGQLKRLRNFRARNCSLTGTIPIDFTVTRASFLDFGMNEHTGTIYSNFGNVKSLEEFSLDSNQFSGTIPSELASLEVLSSLNLDSNGLSGSVPSEFSRLRNLEKFSVTNNSITGSIPEGMCTVLPELGKEDIGCDIKCTCCSGWKEACGIVQV